MKNSFKKIAIILLASFLFANAASFLWVSFIEHDVHHLCPFTASVNSDCPVMENAYFLALHHMNKIQQLSNGIISIVSLFAIYILWRSVSDIVKFNFSNPKINFFRKFYHKFNSEIKLYRIRFNKWMALNNLRPSNMFLRRLVF